MNCYVGDTCDVPAADLAGTKGGERWRWEPPCHVWLQLLDVCGGGGVHHGRLAEAQGVELWGPGVARNVDPGVCEHHLQKHHTRPSVSTHPYLVPRLITASKIGLIPTSNHTTHTCLFLEMPIAFAEMNCSEGITTTIAFHIMHLIAMPTQTWSSNLADVLAQLHAHERVHPHVNGFYCLPFPASMFEWGRGACCAVEVGIFTSKVVR